LTEVRVLVTGGAGFIGSHLVQRLARSGYTVTVVDDCSTGSRSNLEDDIELLELDLGQRRSLEALSGRRFDVVCHLAGQSSGEKSFDDPVHDFDANARSTAILSSWAVETGVKTFLHASSMSVYGQPSALPVREDAPTAPLSYYGASKLAAEQVLAVACAHGLRTASLRMFSVYGPGQDLSELRQGMASIFLAYLLKGEAVPVTGSLDRVRDLVHVDDVSAAWQRAIERPVSGVLNIGTGIGTSVRDLIHRLVAVLGLPPDHPVRELGTSPGDQHSVYADIARARHELGWEPSISLEEGLASLKRWAVEAARP
jgi:UDP-glucose 4-epimerase